VFDSKTTVHESLMGKGKGECPMSSTARLNLKRWDWHRIIFTILAGVVTFFLLTNLFRLAAPWASMAWYPHDDPRQLNLDLHRWHEAMWGAVTGILNAGVLLSLLWRPRETPLLIQFIAFVVIGAVLIVLPFEPGLLFVIFMMTLVVVSYPMPRALLDFSHREPLSRPLLLFSVVAAVLLVPYMVRLEIWQIQGIGGEQAIANEWVGDVEHSAFLLVAMFLASTKRPGWQTLSILTGIVFIYLGIAALALPNHAGSWGTAGGIAALIGGLLYEAATIRELRRNKREAPSVLPSAVG
jgi:hypothetical protein